MSQGFLYFLPGAAAAAAPADGQPGFAARLREYGLDDRLERVAARAVLHGPGGQAGCLVGQPRRSPAEVAYDAAGQWWAALEHLAREDRPAPWIGCAAADPAVFSAPDEADLRRSTCRDGAAVAFGGQLWRAPLLRSWDGETFRAAVETTWTLDGRGEWTSGAVIADERPAWEAVVAYCEALLGRRTPTVAELLDGAVEVLRLQYRIGRWEAGQLGLTAGAAGRILYEAAGLGSYEMWLQKKTAAAGSPTSAGAADAPPPTTDPARPS